MPTDGTDTFTPMSPEQWKASLLAKKAASGGTFKPMSPEEWKASYQAKKSSAVPDASKMTQAQAVQQLEGGGLKAPMIDPVDVGVFAATGGASGLAQGGLKLAGKEALKEGGAVAASEAWNAAQEPLIEKIPGQGVAGNLTRDVARVAGGMVPFVVAGAGPQAAAGAFRKMGGANEIAEAASTAAAKASEQTEAAQAAMTEQAKKSGQELDTNYEKFRQQQASGAKDEAQAETVASTLGKTRQQTRDTRFDAGHADRQAVQRNIIFEKSNEAAGELGKEYDATFSKYDARPLPLNATAQKATQLEQWAEANNIALSPTTKKLLAESKSFANPMEGKQVTGFANLKPSVSGARQAREALGITEQQWGAMSKTDQDFALASVKGKASPAAPPTTTTTVAQGRGLKSKWGEEMSGAQGPDGYVARQMRDAVLADLDASGVPGAKELNNRYRAFRNGGLGDYDFLGKVAGPKGGEIHNVAGEIFNNPQRGMDFVKRLSPEQKPEMKDLYADYINTGGKVSPDHAPILKALGFKGPLAKPEAWPYLDKAETNLAEVLSTNPIAKKKFMASLEAKRAELSTSSSKETVKIALDQADKLGGTGERIRAQIEAAKTPEEQARVALKSFGALSPAEEGKQAGVQAIQQFKPSSSGGLLNRLKYRAEIYLILAAGTPGSMLQKAAILGTAAGIGEGIRASVRSAIRNNAEAEYYRAITNPGLKDSLGIIAEQVIKSSLPAEAAQVGQAATSKKTGPMITHIEHEKAKAIVGPRGAISPERISRVEDLNKDIAKGDAPEVHADLRNGRLTHTDLAKMVQPDKPGLSNLFAGMSPQQAVDAFATADPSERELTLPALAQHIQNTAGKLPPQDRQRIFARIKAVLQPQQEQTA